MTHTTKLEQLDLALKDNPNLKMAFTNTQVYIRSRKSSITGPVTTDHPLYLLYLIALTHFKTPFQSIEFSINVEEDQVFVILLQKDPNTQNNAVTIQKHSEDTLPPYLVASCKEMATNLHKTLNEREDENKEWTTYSFEEISSPSAHTSINKSGARQKILDHPAIAHFIG